MPTILQGKSFIRKYCLDILANNYRVTISERKLRKQIVAHVLEVFYYDTDQKNYATQASFVKQTRDWLALKKKLLTNKYMGVVLP